MRFLNHYNSWSTRRVIRTTRQAVLQQLLAHPPHHNNVPARILIDLTTLTETGKFKHLSTTTRDFQTTERWIRMLNGKRGLHLVVLYIDYFNAEGISIGSGAIESSIKQLGRRIKISGAQWNRENVAQVLRQRCAYLNGSFSS